MSLDVYLITKQPAKKKGTGIFVRENGSNRELSAEEAAERYPDVVLSEREEESDVIYSDNITHNLAEMAQAAGLYKHLWRPEDLGITTAGQLIEPLREGLHQLKSDPVKFQKYNPENGWGSYTGLVKFVSDYLDACYDYPDATVEANR